MELKDIATGAGGGGLLATVFTWHGIKSKMDDMSNSIKDRVHTNSCTITHKAADEKFDSIEKRFDKVDEKLDRLIEHSLQHRRVD